MTKTKRKAVTWDMPHDVDMLTAAFPGPVTGGLLPPMSAIPPEFHDDDRNKWCNLASKLFFSGGKLPATKEGIDPRRVAQHLSAVLGSFEPKHEHKIAGAGWLLSLWCVEPK